MIERERNRKEGSGGSPWGLEVEMALDVSATEDPRLTDDR